MMDYQNNFGKENRWVKGMAWALITALSNPIFLIPTVYSTSASARDTDIYLNVAGASSNSPQPQALLVLDTSDSMNIPEAWREYPGGYDSHVEYLWADREILCGNGSLATDAAHCDEVPAEDGSKISTVEYPAVPESIFGTWSGATLAERQALWQAAVDSAFATFTDPDSTVDPGPRHTWRNYNDLSWIYWLPASAAESDVKLTSPSWNRFRGYVQRIGNNTSDGIGGVGTVTNTVLGAGGALRGGMAFYDTNNYRGFNKCATSLDDLTPSTVMVPTSYAKNSGKVLGQQFARWQPFMNLTTVGLSGYPGGSNQATAGYAAGYLNQTTNPTGSPSNNSVYRDSTGTSPVGSKGLPIRYNDGSAGAGWEDVRADLGGYNFFSEIDSYTSGNLSQLTTISGWYSLPAATDVDSSGATNIDDSKFIAWKGNRDAGSVAFGTMTGVSSYYDIGAPGSGASPVACDADAGAPGASATCIGKLISAAIPPITVTKTATCGMTGSTSEIDAAGNTRVRNGVCSATVSCSGDTNGASYPNCSDVTDPVCASPTTTNQTIKTVDNKSCGRTGTTNYYVEPCVVQGATTVSVPSCAWSGQLPVSIAACALTGQSTVSIGTCALADTSTVNIGTCTRAGTTDVVINSCQWSGRSNTTVGTCAWSGRQAAKAEGLGWYAYGGTCAANGDASVCSTASTTTISGQSLATGYFISQSAALASSSGCSNSVAAGTVFYYGGTCGESGSTDSCELSGVSTRTISGTVYNDVYAGSATAGCQNKSGYAAGTYKSGGTCTENGSTDSCDFTAGTTKLVRGTNYTGSTALNRTCSNKTGYAAGTVTYGGTCKENGSVDSCNTSTGTSKTIRGTSYTVGKTCSNKTGFSAGTYNYGGSCKENGSTTHCGTSAGSDKTIRGVEYNGFGRTCSQLDATGTWYYGGVCDNSVNTTCVAGATANKNIRGDTYVLQSTCTGSAGGSITYGGNCVSSGTSAYTHITNTCTTNTGPDQTFFGTTYPGAVSCSASLTSGDYLNLGGSCAGTIVSIPGAPGSGDVRTTQTGQSSACTQGVQDDYTTTLGMTRISCTDKSDTSTTCTARYGAGNCTTACASPATSTSTTGGAVAAVYKYYKVYNNAGSKNYLYHSCKADEVSGSYMRSTPLRALWTDYDPSTSAGVGSMTTNAGEQVAADASKNINLYSVNYLNWKYGPRGPNGHPIGRKTRLQIAKDALTELVQTLDGVRFGLMVFNKMDTNFNTQGGNVVYGIRPMGTTCAVGSTAGDCANRTELITRINGVVATSQTPLTETMFEAYRYFSGGAPYFGTPTSSGVTASTASARGGGQVTDGRDTSVIDSGSYRSPMLDNPSTGNGAPCQKNYIVLISDGGPENDIGADAQIRLLEDGPTRTVQATDSEQFEKNNLASYTNCAAGMSPFCPTDIGASSNYVWLDELTYFMANADVNTASPMTGTQSVRTHTIGFAGGSSEVLKNAAYVGGGIYRDAKDSEGLKEALYETFSAIRDWNPSGSAGAVPISAFNRSESANDIFLSFFAPQNDTAWDGTVKKYKIATNTASCGVDVDANPVKFCLTGLVDFGGGVRNIEKYLKDPDTGQYGSEVRKDSASYWGDVNDPDGSWANKGGTGRVLRTTTTPADRKIYTYLSGNDVNLTLDENKFDTANALLTGALGSFGFTNATEQNKFINYVRGGNPLLCDGASSSCSAAANWRSWGHNDVLHSRPSMLLYESLADSNPSVDANGDGNPANDVTPVQHMFYLSNDGLLHAVNTETGVEQWAFAVEEVLPNIKDMMEDINNQEHVIGADGSPIVYAKDIAQVDGTAGADGKITSHDKAYVVFGLRRGGRSYYALDVSNYDPASSANNVQTVTPKLLWKVSSDCGGDTTNCLEIPELGESWSTPSVVPMKAGGSEPVVVFGGGYDPVPNDMLSITISHTAGVATVTTSAPHHYQAGDQVKISGADDSMLDFNGVKAIATVVNSRVFTYAVDSGLPSVAYAKKGETLKVVHTRSDNMGRGVFFVKTTIGASPQASLLASFSPAATAGVNKQVAGMTYSIPSDAEALNADLDAAGYADRLYIGDMGGNLWRLDVGPASTSLWDATKLADLSESESIKRKIFFPPAVVKQSINLGTSNQRFDAVYVGTGDWQNPMRKDVADKFFMIKDFGVGPTAYVDADGDKVTYNYNASSEFNSTNDPLHFYNIESNLIQSADATNRASAESAIFNSAGWVLPLNVLRNTDGTVKPGEKAVNAPTVFNNVLRFGTYLPDYTNCTGRGLMYAMDARNGKVIFDTNRNGLIDPSSDSRAFLSDFMRGYPSTGTVIVLNGEALILHTSDGTTKIDKVMDVGRGRRTYWYQEPEQ